jgi:PPK2 family polyphosphate:nucleotide phosphotransferase
MTMTMTMSMSTITIKHYRVKPGSDVDLKAVPTDDHGDLTKPKGIAEFLKLRKRLTGLQELLYAEGKHALLVVLQAMDAGGKDGTIRSVFSSLNPQGCKVVSFKAPNDVERRHDFLWRIHENTPRLGFIGIFNRSHYEDVLIARVKNLVPERRWRARYDHINAFEEMLRDEGTTTVKFFLHISKEYQKRRLERRLAKPSKHWKFDPSDLAERERWDEYQAAYRDALRRCSTPHAPWYVIPAEHHWYRNLLIARVLVETLESLEMRYPKARFDPRQIVIP